MLMQLCLGWTLALPLAGAEPPRAQAASLSPAELSSLVDLYQHLHRNPELSYHEVETAKRLADELRRAGAQVTAGVGGTGVVGLLSNGNGPTVLVRTDLDALPIREDTGLPYASAAQTSDDEGNPVGVMHACGHDVHMTCLVGVARWLAQHKDAWSGTVALIGQPAEEKVGGAKAMLADGLYDRFPRPDFALALHVAHDLEAGKVGYCPGPAMAGSTSVDIHVHGKGGHGAMPQNTVDPIVLSAALILDLQTIVSREVNPLDPAVITVGAIHGGSKHNIIPPEVHLQLTLRAYKEDVRALLIDGLERRARSLAQAHRAPAPSITIGESTPPTINTPALVDRVKPAFIEALGQENVVESPPTMGAEDFGLFGRDGVPTFMFRLGTISAQRLAQAAESPLPSLHSPFYFPEPEPSIATGVRSMTAAVLELLPRR